MEIEENNHEDKSQQISASEVKKYAEFARDHGRKIFNNGMILPSKYNKPTIDRLYEDEGILDGKQRDIGVTFKNLCDCAEGRMVAASNLEDPNAKPIGPELKVMAVYEQLDKQEKFYINLILFEELTNSDFSALHKLAGNIQKAFEALWDAMKTDNIIATLERIQRKALDRREIIRNNANVSHATTATFSNHPE